MEQMKLNDLIDWVNQHEGLMPSQTPFRIMNPTMASWNTIHGYKVKKGAKPKGRQNFIFLENPNEVAPAVQTQFMKYAKTPQKYGLPNNPTIAQAIQVFDQTGAPNKLKFLIQKGVDIDAPLSSLEM